MRNGIFFLALVVLCGCVTTPSPESRYTHEAAIAELIDMLDSENESIQWAAFESLVKYQERAIPQLAKTLKGDDFHKASWAAAALATIGDAKSKSAMKRGLRHEDPSVQIFCAWGLWRLGEPLEKKVLWRHISNQEVEVQEDLLWVLVDIQEDEFFDHLIQSASSEKEESIRYYAVRGLAYFKDPQAVPVLIEALDSESIHTRLMAVWALGEIGDPAAVSALLMQASLLAKPGLPGTEGIEDWRVISWRSELSYRIEESLVRIGDLSMVPSLILMLGEEGDSYTDEYSEDIAFWIMSNGDRPFDDAEETIAANVLFEIGDPVVPVLMDALESSDRGIRWRSVETLGRLQESSAVPALLESLGDPEEDVRWRVVKVLGDLESKVAVSSLIRLLRDESARVRYSAVESLGKIGGSEAEEAVISMVYDPDVEVRSKVTSVLAEFGSKKAVNALMLILDDPANREYLDHFSEILRGIKNPEAVPFLSGLLDHPVEDVQQDSAYALSYIDSEEATRAVSEKLDDPGWKPRNWIFYMGGNIRPSMDTMLEEIKRSGPLEFEWQFFPFDLENKSPEFERALFEGLDSENLNLKLSAAAILNQYGHPGMFDVIESVIVSSSNKEDRELAFRALKRFRIADSSLAPRVISLLRYHDDFEVIAMVLSELEEEPIEFLLESAQDPDHEFRERVFWLIGRYEEKRAEPILLDALKEDGHYGAMYALGEINSSKAVPYLLEMLEIERNRPLSGRWIEYCPDEIEIDVMIGKKDQDPESCSQELDKVWREDENISIEHIESALFSIGDLRFSSIVIQKFEDESLLRAQVRRSLAALGEGRALSPLGRIFERPPVSRRRDDAKQVSEVAGTWAHVYEGSIFQPCGTDEYWWVEGNVPHDEYDHVTLYRGQKVFMRASGAVKKKGISRHGIVERHFSIENLHEIRRPSENDCKGMEFSQDALQ